MARIYPEGCPGRSWTVLPPLQDWGITVDQLGAAQKLLEVVSRSLHWD